MSVKSVVGVLSAVLLVILCITSQSHCDVSHVVVGGESPVDTGTIEILRRNISNYLVELEHSGSPQMQLTQIYSASKQIVTGTLYTVEALLQTADGAKKCQIRVLEKPWIDFCQVRVNCEHGGHYEVTFNPNHISQDVSQALQPISQYLQPAFDFKPQPAPVSVPQNPFLNQFSTSYGQQQGFTTLKPFTTFKPFTTYKPFEFKPTQSPIFKPQPVYKAPSYPTLAPYNPQTLKPLTYLPPKPVTYDFPKFTTLKPLPTLPPLKPIYKAPPTLAPLPPLKPLPTLPKAPTTFPTFKPVYKPLPTLPPLPPKPVYKPLPTLPPQPITFAPPIQHDFPVKPTAFPKPPKPELNVLPFDQVPTGPALDKYLNNLFHDFMAKYEREYIAEPSEMAYRFDVFKENFHTMHEHSKVDRLAAQYSVTEFADLTDNEFSRILGYDTDLLNSTSAAEGIEDAFPESEGRSAGGDDGGEIPEHYDQRDDNLVTRVKFQGDCGACWAFVTVAVVEGLCAKRTKMLQEFSEQSLIDCDNTNYGCKGGVPPNAVKHILKRGGLELESIYPYEYAKKTCRFKPPTVKVKVASPVKFNKNDEAGMARWVFKNGPVEVGVNAAPLKYYKGGVLNPTPKLCNPKKINHAVTLIGYGVEVNTSSGEKLPYWIVKNSWGTQWGESGFFRIARGKNACGLASFAGSARLADVSNNCKLNGA